MSQTSPRFDRAEAVTDRMLDALDMVGDTVLSRRRTLQIGAGVAAGSIMAGRLPFVRNLVGLGTAEATEVPSTVVLVYLDGGNDGLNTLVPLTNPKYHEYRGALAIPGTSTLPINGDYGLHTALPFMHSMWSSGRAAFVRGVGYTNNNLSHFSSIDHWHYGYGAAGSPVFSSPHSGWAGRYADTIGPSNPFTAVAIGPHTPVSLRGNSVAALQIPIPQSQLFGANMADLNEKWVADALRSINTTGSGTGTLGNSLTARTVSAIDVAPTVSTSWNGVDGTAINRQMTMAANLINARLGVRVISVIIDGFDTHAQQAVTHTRLLGDLDTALSTFFSRLDPTLNRSVAVMTYSEFGRRARANNSAGTDHGSSSIAMLLGANVAGGIYGDEPGLATLDAAGNPLVTTDFRRLYSTMLASWLGTDPDPILGAAHVPLPLFAAQPGVIPTTTTTSTTRAPAPQAGASTLVPATRAAAPDSPSSATGERVAPPAAGPGVTTSTPAAIAGSAAALDVASTTQASGTTVPTSVPTTLPAASPATQPDAQAAAVPTTTLQPVATQPVQPIEQPMIQPMPQPAPLENVVSSGAGVILPTELVVPGNGAVVAPSSTVPGTTVLVTVGPPTTTAATAPTTAPAARPSSTFPATTSRLRVAVTAQSRTISASVTNGPLRNDTWLGLYATTAPTAKPLAVRYLNNQPRPGIVTRTSGAVNFTGLAKGTYFVRVFAGGATTPVRNLRVVVA